MKTTIENIDIMNWAVRDAFDGKIEIDRTETIGWGVNWSAMGTQSEEDTKAFAENMMIACNIVSYLNKNDIVGDWELEEEHYANKAEMKAVASKASDLIRRGKAEMAMMVIFEYVEEIR